MSYTEWPIPGPYRNASGGPVDPYYLLRTSETTYRPYNTPAEAVAAVPLSDRDGRIVNILGIDNWWSPGITADNQLIVKVNSKQPVNNLLANAASNVTPPTIDAVNAGILVQQNRIDTLVNGAPAALNTLLEIANQIANDENGVAAILSTQQSHTQLITNNSNAIQQGVQYQVYTAGTNSGQIVAIGASNAATNYRSSVLAGESSNARGGYSIIAGGYIQNANGNWVFIAGGRNNTMNGGGAGGQGDAYGIIAGSSYCTTNASYCGVYNSSACTIAAGCDYTTLIGCNGLNVTSGSHQLYVNNVLYALPPAAAGPATATNAGLVKIGTGITVAADGTISAASGLTNTDGLVEGTTNLYFTSARAIGASILGYVKAGVNATLLATDSILIALGKLEKKTDDNTAALGTAIPLVSITAAGVRTIGAATFQACLNQAGEGGAVVSNRTTQGNIGIGRGITVDLQGHQLDLQGTDLHMYSGAKIINNSLIHNGRIYIRDGNGSGVQSIQGGTIATQIFSQSGTNPLFRLIGVQVINMGDHLAAQATLSPAQGSNNGDLQIELSKGANFFLCSPVAATVVTTIADSTGAGTSAPATATALGVVKIGNGITIATDGTISVNAGTQSGIGQFNPYTATAAGAQTIALATGAVGALNIGVIESSGADRPIPPTEYSVTNGVLNITAAAQVAVGDVITGYYYGPNGASTSGSGSTAPATATTLGTVKIGSGVVVATDGTISVATPIDPRKDLVTVSGNRTNTVVLEAKCSFSNPVLGPNAQSFSGQVIKAATSPATAVSAARAGTPAQVLTAINADIAALSATDATLVYVRFITIPITSTDEAHVLLTVTLT